jgi:hypothetical protein
VCLRRADPVRRHSSSFFISSVPPCELPAYDASTLTVRFSPYLPWLCLYNITDGEVWVGRELRALWHVGPEAQRVYCSAPNILSDAWTSSDAFFVFDFILPIVALYVVLFAILRCARIVERKQHRRLRAMLPSSPLPPRPPPLPPVELSQSVVHEEHSYAFYEAVDDDGDGKEMHMYPDVPPISTESTYSSIRSLYDHDKNQ